MSLWRVCGRVRVSRLLQLVGLVMIFMVLSTVISPTTSHAKPIAPPDAPAVLDLKGAPHQPSHRVVDVRREEVARMPVEEPSKFERRLGNVAPPGPVRTAPQRLETITRGTARVAATAKEQVFIDGHLYPKVSDEGNFIPLRRLVHLDLKGAAYKPEFFTDIFFFLNKIGATGVLLEWEDTFPYTGKLAEALNGRAYSIEQVQNILQSAKQHRLEVVPLVQTFGHLEWILKLKQFAHLREDSNIPQVMCAALPEAWQLLTDMVNQVAAVHKKYGMPFFHMGADEVFQIGICNASAEAVREHRSRERYMLWHIARMAKHIKENHKTTVLAWHDMVAQAWPTDLSEYSLPSLLEPVIWSYAEDLSVYLTHSTWEGLRAFPRVWCSSAWKGADGPARFSSNPVHYVRNHESWTQQMTANHETTVIQGLIMAGWSRYDHMAILAELIPIAIPSLAMSMETVKSARRLNGRYPESIEWLGCEAPVEPGFVSGCRFPGYKVYELVNQFSSMSKMLKEYRETDYDLNGWLSRSADRFQYSSSWYIQKLEPNLQYHYKPMKKLEMDLRTELGKIYYDDTVDEFIYTYLGEDLDWLEKKLATCEAVLQRGSFEKRPFRWAREL